MNVCYLEDTKYVAEVDGSLHSLGEYAAPSVAYKAATLLHAEWEELRVGEVDHTTNTIHWFKKIKNPDGVQVKKGIHCLPEKIICTILYGMFCYACYIGVIHF